MTRALDRLLEELVLRGHRGMGLGLERTVRAARALGDPQESLAVLHVAGTNGKGSTAAMLERIARAAGKRTGLYTSPHLVRFNERIQVNGSPLGDLAFEQALGRVLRDAPSELTFFETLTLAGFVAFREAAVDVAVLEVGLGGRLDATNVVSRPVGTAIVSLTEGEGGRYLEHADYLGADVATIAREKAGILKVGVPAVLGPLPALAREAVLETADAVGAWPVWEVRGPPRPGPIELPDGVVVSLQPRLAGGHQLDNAAVAAALAWVTFDRLGLGVAAIEAGIARAEWPGRLERIPHEGRDVWLDSAHNLEGARALARALPELGLRPDRTTLLFGALADKPFEPVLRILAPYARARVYTLAPGRKAAPLAELAQLAPGEAVAEPEAALARALEQTEPGGAVLVTGSIYLVGRIRGLLLGIRPDPAMGL